jgi:putative peptidoglycan lipid II flippase
MKKTAAILMLITISSKILGFLRDVVLSYYYGASNISDAYLVSITIPMVIFSFIGIGITTGYIPNYNQISKKYGDKAAIKFTNNLVNILLLVNTIIIIIGLFFTDVLVKIFASGFTSETLKLAIIFSKISMFGIYFTGTIYVFSGFLQLKGNYVMPALVGFPLNFFILISIIISYRVNILFLSIGTVIATATQLLFLVPSLKGVNYQYKFFIDFKDENFIKMIYTTLPAILGVSVNQINILVDRKIASQIAVGGISALNYSNRLIWFVQGIFVMSITTVMFPMISKMVAEHNLKGLKKSIVESINVINILVLPTTFGAMLLTEPIVKLLFGRGAFDSQAIFMTSDALFFYSIGMIGFGLREVLSRTFYAMQDTKTPMNNAAIAMVMNIILNIILSKFLGIGGLALATSISAIFCTVLLFISLRKKIGPFGMKSITISFIKILCASLVMGVIAKVSYNALLKNMNANLSLIPSICIGALSYFIIIYFMKIEEVDTIVNVIKRKIKCATA